MDIVKDCEKKSKEVNDLFLGKLKVQNEKEEKLKQIKSEKEAIRGRIIELQNMKKKKEEEIQPVEAAWCYWDNQCWLYYLSKLKRSII